MNGEKRKQSGDGDPNGRGYKVAKSIEETGVRRSNRIAEIKWNNYVKEAHWFDLTSLPVVVLYSILNNLVGQDAINFLKVVDGKSLCSNRQFAIKLIDSQVQPIEVNFPFAKGRYRVYYLTASHVRQHNSSRRYVRFANAAFTGCMVNRMCSEYHCDAFETYVRLIPYNVHYVPDVMPVFDVFHNNVFESSRCLNKIELHLFKLSEHNQCDGDRLFVSSIDGLMDNLRQRFGYDEWCKGFDQRYFMIAGNATGE